VTLPAAADSTYFSVRCDLKVSGVVDLRTWGQPFSLSMDALSDTNSAILKTESPQFKTIVETDSLYETVKVRRVLNDEDWDQPAIFTWEGYSQHRLQRDRREQFRDCCVKALQKTAAQAGQDALTIEIPFKIKSKTFNKIFGGDRVRLRIAGNINIQGGFRREGRSQVATVTGQNTDYSFHIDQTQSFKITGEVGDKVSVNVDQNSERMFEFENSLKLTYTGHEDEIIQKIEAGNISMQLQGTQLATFSGQNKGLFGLRTDLKVGALTLTSLASLEKGQKNKVTISGGAQQSSYTIDPKNFVNGRYFFLDYHYRDQYKTFSSEQNMLHVPIQNRWVEPNSYYLYKSYNLVGQAPPPDLINAIAIHDPDEATNLDARYSPAFLDTLQADSVLRVAMTEARNYFAGTFKPMDRSEFYMDEQNGYIRLNNPVSDPNTVLAVVYRTDDNQQYGFTSQAQTDTVLLKLLRPSNPQAGDDTWPLAWKNVYYLGGVNIKKEDFTASVVYEGNSAAEQQTMDFNGETISFLTAMGLDTRNESGQQTPDTKVDDEFINYGTGELIFPDLRPFDPEGYYIGNQSTPATYSDALPESLRIAGIYDDPLTANYTNFKIKADFKSVKAVYELGFNVLEGSEEVMLNGAKLQKGSDYVIDYYSGTLTILNDAALSPSANLDILYESGELFQLDKKTLLGVRAEYALWDQSFIGATALYLNERPLQDRVKLGGEPLRNFLWDVNSRLVFKPQFLTTAVDKLPLIETEAPSQLTLEMEYAQVHPNPNSLDNPSTGDPDGVAYVDDFESIKKTTPLGIMRRQWTLASNPDPGDPERNRGTFVWFNPYDQVSIQDIWPNRPTNSSVAQRTHVLTLYFGPTPPDSAAPTKGSAVAKSWGGVMRALSAGYSNQQKSKYIEVMLRVKDRNSNKFDLPGKLHIDLGQITEDVIPNNVLNTEDIPLPGLTYGNGFLEPEEDVGLDGVAGGDPSDVWPDGTPFLDDWGYNENNKYDVWKINGTEGNINDGLEGRYPDTEDINHNRSLDVTNSYFRYTLDLAETVVDPPDTLTPGGQWQPGTRYLVDVNPAKHWKLYRIPLDAGQPFGNPSLTRIDFARLWVDGMEESDTLEISIATLDIVGNEWEAVPVVTPADTSFERVSVEVINTYDNNSYTAPPGVAGWRDPVTDIISQEQALLLRVNELPRDSAGVIVRRLVDNQDFLEYKTLKMFVHGGSPDAFNQQKFEQDEVWMFFRFGADTSSNYYEYKQRIWPEWDERNNIEIDLEQLTQMKLDRPVPSERYAVLAGGGDTLAIKGNPSLSQIRQYTVGLVCTNRDLTKIDGMEIWLDELRLSNVKKDVGQAARASANLTLADLLTLNASMDTKDGNFHNINTRVGTRANSLSGQATGTLQLHKVFDPQLGLSVPVTANFAQSESVPYYFPNSDILVDQDNPEQLDSVKTYNRNYGAGIDVRKSAPSSNSILKYTVDKLSGGYDYSRAESTSPTTLFSNTTNNSANVAYNLTFGRPAVSPLTWLRGLPVLSAASGLKVYPLITKLNLTLQGTESVTNGRTRSGLGQYNHSFFLTKGVDSGLRPFESLTFDYNRTHKSDLLMHPDRPKGIADILAGDLALDEEMDVTQTVTGSFNPRFIAWLETDARYNTSYHWQWGQGYNLTGQTISNNTTMSASGTLKLTSIFKKPERGGGQGAEPGAPGTGPDYGITPGASGQPYGEPSPEGDPEKSGAEPTVTPPPGFDPSQIPGLQTTPGDTTRPDSALGDSTGIDTTGVPQDTTFYERVEVKREGEGGAIGDLWYGLRYTVTRLRDVRVEYSQQNTWSDPLVDGQAGLGYQLGLSSRDFSRIDSATGVLGFPMRSRSDDYKVRSGLDFSRNFKISLNYNYRWSKSQSNSVNGSVAESQLYFFKADGDSVGIFQIPIPEWSVTWSGWEKFPAFARFTETMSLEHTFTGTKTSTWTDNKDNVNKRDYQRNFSPLLGFNMTFKRGITGSVRYNWTETGTVTLVPTPAKTRSIQTGLQLTVNYALKTGFKVPIPVWPFKNKRFRNNTTFSLTFNMTNNRQENEASGAFVETSFSKMWSIKPSMDYTFSNTVTGGVHFEYGKNSSKTGDSNFQDFGIRVNITIRG